MNRLVVMGVSGCGKSTLAAALAQALHCTAIEGDAYHLPASQAKMRAGEPLTDADREPWLDRLGQLLAAAPGDAVLSCSALKRSYRDRLRARVPPLRFVFIEIDPALALQRVAARPGHFFPAALVASQFEALESPLGESGVLGVSAALALPEQVGTALRWLEAG
ncbi:MAG: gluconokinase [Burkholderiaceae bacterium]